VIKKCDQLEKDNDVIPTKHKWTNVEDILDLTTEMQIYDTIDIYD
jgi:hypothetical protein